MPAGLADDRADHEAAAPRSRKRGEEVRHRCRQAQLPVDLAPRGGVRAEQLERRGSAARRPRRAAIVTGKKVRYVAITTTDSQPA